MEITRRDNGDGTVTFVGVEVTIPKEIAETHDVVSVRRPRKGEAIESGGEVIIAPSDFDDEGTSVYAILRQRPKWNPPVFLAPGEYRWNGSLWTSDGHALWGPEGVRVRCVFRSMEKPTKNGRWQVNQDGSATYLGE